MLEETKTFSSKNIKVLYVDDEEINLRAFSRAFRRNFDVVTANSAREALNILANDKTVHIVVSDQRMPEMTGIELLEKIILTDPEVIRIILTGYSDEEDIKKAINKCGIFRYLTKPWDEEELISVLKQADETYRLRSDNQKLILELKKHNDELESKIQERTSEIEEQKEQILIQNQILEEALAEVENALKDVEFAVSELESKNTALHEAHERIKDSITYAKNIQNAILPHIEDIKKEVSDFFVIHWAKDVVSGDFYWAKKTKDAFYIALGDCTGHGVPGAFMTVMSSVLLNQIMQSEYELTSDAVLCLLHDHICESLKQDTTENRDGLDIAFCKIKTLENNTFLLEFAGAHRPLFYTKNGELHGFAQNRFPIGGKLKQNRCYDSFQVILDKGEKIYAFSDGVADLPNEERNKLGQKSLVALLEAVCHLPIDEQNTKIVAALNEHKGSILDIRDDVTFFCVQL